MKEDTTPGGYRKIYEDLLERLGTADVAASAERLGLEVNGAGEAEVPFLGTTFGVSNGGVRRADGRGFNDTAGSVLIHYVLNGSASRPAGVFVRYAQLAGPVFRPGSYSDSALERPLVQRFEGHVPELLARAPSYGGRRGGVAGAGSVSLIFDLLPHLPLQLVFYDRDHEFRGRATLLFDRNATRLIEFEVLAVAVTLFVRSLTKP